MSEAAPCFLQAALTFILTLLLLLPMHILQAYMLYITSGLSMQLLLLISALTNASFVLWILQTVDMLLIPWPNHVSAQWPLPLMLDQKQYTFYPYIL